MVGVVVSRHVESHQDVTTWRATTPASSRAGGADGLELLALGRGRSGPRGSSRFAPDNGAYAKSRPHPSRALQ